MSKARPAICDNGRYETVLFSGPIRSGLELKSMLIVASAFQVRLSCEIMHPLGGPVVPEV